MKFSQSYDLDRHYTEIKEALLKHDVRCNPYRDINYGIQFKIFLNDISGTLRVYKGKKGTTLDCSQIKNDDLQVFVEGVLGVQFADIEPAVNSMFKKPQDMDDVLNYHTLIGVDESGKGDYFGPLCVAAVYTTEDTYTQLQNIGVQDSKLLSDSDIISLSKSIEAICESAILIVQNEQYNTLHQEYKNLNHILAWAHSKVLATVHDQTKCETFLCDKFCDHSLIHSGLMAKGIMIKPHEVVRAESNIAVAAASILARSAFVRSMKQLSSTYNIQLPKGAGPAVIRAGTKLVETQGEDVLSFLAKTHFNITGKIKDS